MTAYADSSFLVRLIVDEIGSEEAVAVFRQLQRPQLVFNCLHSLEVRNALRQNCRVPSEHRSPKIFPGGRRDWRLT